MIDDGETGAEDITNQILHDPILLKSFFEGIMSYDTPDCEASKILNSIDDLTTKRRDEIKDADQQIIEQSINTGKFHRFSGFMNYEP